MKITFLGACHEVTGSCFLVSVGSKNILVDCGMEQGPDLYQNQPLPLNPVDIDAVVLTHAHIDHSGNLPLLAKGGFNGPIYLTKVSAELCKIMLKDCAHIQEAEAEWRDRKAKRQGKKNYEPLYVMRDAETALKLLAPVEYEKRINIVEGITATFYDAGHLLGSASVKLDLTENGISKSVVFSGDIGNVEQPLLKDPTYLSDADYVLIESTYGERSHDTLKVDYAHNLAEVINRTFSRGGNVIIPSFAVGRTQEMLYFLREIKANNLVSEFGNWSVYVDSPLAIEATGIFNRNVECCCDSETTALIEAGINPIGFDGLKMTVSTEESIGINFDKKPKVVLSASGMCEAGRIRHHLKHNLWRPESTVLFVGYQALGTLGRALVDGNVKYVSLFGEEVKVRAEIVALPGTSAHADREGLIKWAKQFKNTPKRFFVVHGEDGVADRFTELLQNSTGVAASAPYNGCIWDLTLDEELVHGNDKRLIKVVKQDVIRQSSPLYRELSASASLLMQVVKENEGGTNFDLKSFIDDIYKLISKYKR